MTDVSIIAAVGSDASGFRSFKDTPSPRPLGLSLNVSGDRLAVALSDHRLRVCSRGKDLASEWELLDEWRAHDAEILDASLIRVYLIPWRYLIAELDSMVRLHTRTISGVRRARFQVQALETGTLSYKRTPIPLHLYPCYARSRTI